MAYVVTLTLRDDGAELETLTTRSLTEAVAARDRLAADLRADGYAWYKGRGAVAVYAHPDGASPDLELAMRGGQ
jgi:hypothetical protein